MDNWNLYGQPPAKASRVRGRWYFPLTILALLLVGGLSMLMAWLTADIPERQPLLMGLIFMVPAGAMFFSALLMEFSTGAMTPRYTRGPQIIVAVVATLLTFLIGLLCDTIYTMGGYAAQVKPNVVFMLDNTGSMLEPSDYSRSSSPTRQTVAVNSLNDVLDHMDDGYSVGFLYFDHLYHFDPEQSSKMSLPVKRLDSLQRQSISEMISSLSKGGATLFYEPLKYALGMIQHLDNGRDNRIIIITDGIESGTVNGKSITHLYLNPERNKELAALCAERNATIYSLSMFSEIDANLRDLVIMTGGQCVQTEDPATILNFMQEATKAEGDMIRSDMTSATVITAIMLLLEGIIIGIGLSLMLSVQGQFRYQIILSPLMGVAAFLIIKVIKPDFGEPWIVEGLSLGMLGIVFMTSNRHRLAVDAAPAQDGHAASFAQPAPAARTTPAKRTNTTAASYSSSDFPMDDF